MSQTFGVRPNQKQNGKTMRRAAALIKCSKPSPEDRGRVLSDQVAKPYQNVSRETFLSDSRPRSVKPRAQSSIVAGYGILFAW